MRASHFEGSKCYLKTNLKTNHHEISSSPFPHFHGFTMTIEDRNLVATQCILIRHSTKIKIFFGFLICQIWTDGRCKALIHMAASSHTTVPIKLRYLNNLGTSWATYGSNSCLACSKTTEKPKAAPCNWITVASGYGRAFRFAHFHFTILAYYH